MQPRIDTTRISPGAYKAMRGLQSYVDATSLKPSAPRGATSAPSNQIYGSDPAKLLHGPSGVPDFRHVVICHRRIPSHRRSLCRALASGWTWAALASVGRREDPISTNALSFVVCSERLHVIPSIGHEREETLHPVKCTAQAFERQPAVRIAPRNWRWACNMLCIPPSLFLFRTPRRTVWRSLLCSTCPSS